LNNGSSTTALQKSGLDLWVLTGTGNNYTGALTINQGSLRVVNASGLGGTGTLSFGASSNGQGLDIRSDAAPTGIRSISNNSATNAYIYLDHAATDGNATTGQTITFGTVAQANNTAAITFVGNHGYGVVLGVNTLAASNTTAATLTTYTITNDLGSPGLTGYSVGANEFISIAGFADSGANTAGVTQTLNGWGNYTITGAISNTGTQPLNLTKSGSGVLTYSPTTLTGWNTGTLTLSGGTTRIASSIATGGATVTLGAALIELRNNASTNFGFNVANVSSTSTLFIDHALGGTTTAQTATIGTLTLNSATTLNVVGDHGYSLVTGLITQKGTVSSVIANYLAAPGYAGYTGGTITLGGGTTDATAGVATLTLAGFGDFTLGGTISSPTAGVSLNITKTTLGVATFGGNNSGWTNATQGILNANGGTTLIDATNTNAIGSVNLTGTAGMLGILGASGTSGATWTGKNLIASGAFTLVADPLAGSSVTGQTVNLGSYTGGSTMIVDSNHGYGVTFNAAGTTGASSTVTNVGNGTVTFAGGLATTGAFTWTLNGPGDYNVSGNITNGTGTTAFTKSGYGTTTLGGTNTIGGALTLSGGILRVTNAGAFGGAGGITTQGGNNNSVGSMGFDFRNDSGMDLSSRSAGSGGYNYSINVDRAIGGSGSNQTISIGGGSWAGATGTSWGYTVTGANGYSLQYKGAAFTVIQGMAAPIINNYIASISGNGGIIFNSGITFTNTTTLTGISLGGTGEYLLSGALTSQSGTTTVATVTKGGTGALTISNDNSSTWNSVLNNEVITVSAGILRLTNGGGLGGSNAVYNQNGGVLDLRSDAGITQTGPVITVGATSTINVDRSIGGTGTGGTQTITSLKDNGVFSVYTTGGTQSGGNAYNLAINTFTVGGAGTAGTPTLINTIGNGGVLRIGTLAGAAGLNVIVNGSGNTNVTTALTANTGSLTKSGTGTLTISGPAGYAGTNTHGAVTVNGGTLTLDFTGITAPTNLLQQSAGLALGAASAGGVSGGTLILKAAASGTTAQTLTTLALAAGQDNITMIAGGTSNTLTFSSGITATNAGSTALITAPANTSVSVATALNTAATTGRNLVFFDGTSYNWATNTGTGTAFIANSNAASAAAVKYATLLLTAGTDAANSQITASGTTSLSGARITNSLMINTSGAGGTLALGANMLTLTQGGLLFTDSTDYFITGTSATNGLKSATATNSDVVINNYGTGLLNIQAPIIQGTGTSTLTLGGTGTTVLGNSVVLTTVGTYTGITYINSGTVILAAGIVGLGASNTALTQNGGTFDLNGNNVVIGAFNGGPAAVIDNNPTGSTAASLTIGAGNGTGTFNGTIKDTKGALTIIKSGTGAITLGDAVTGGSNLFTGDLRFTGASTLTLNSLADTAGAKVDFNATGAILKFAGRSNLTLNSRAFDISAAGGSATIDSSSTAGSINGTNAVMTIGSAFAPTGSGTLSLTLQGSAGNVANGGTGSGVGDGISGITGSGNVAVVNSFTGTIGNGTGGGTVALTIAGAGGWSLGGNNTYSAGTTISSTGLVRATSGTAFGSGTVNVTGTGTLDLRSDSSLTFTNGFTMNGSFTINVDRAIGGNGYGQIMNIGMLTEATGGKTLTVNNLTGASTQTGSGVINGYGLHIAGLALTNGSATNIQNNMGSSGAAEFVIPVAGTGVAGALVIDGVAAAASLGTHTLTFGTGTGNNFGVTVINGDITQGAGTTLGITVAGGGGNAQFITLAGQTAASNYSGGLTFNVGSGLATVRVTNAYALGSGTVSFTGTVGAATLEVRSDTSLTFANNITLGNTGTARTNLLTVGEALNGSSGRNNTFTFGTLGFQGITANALTVAGIAGSTDNSGNSVTFGGVSLGNGSFNGAATFTVTNSLLLPGVLNLGNVSSTNTTAGTTQTLTIAGAGVTTLVNVTDSATATALTAINFTGTGVLDLSGATSANLYTGGLTLAAGTTRVTNAFGLGGSANVINFSAGGQLELRSDTDVTYTNLMLLNATGTGSITVGQLPGGTGVNGATGVMFTLGQLKIGTTGKAFAVNGIGGSLATSAASVTLGGVDLNGIAATTITNNLQLPGMLNVGNVSSTTAGTAVLTFNGSGVTLVGDVTNGAATSVALTFTGTGILDLSRMTAATNYSGGLNINTATAAALVRITDALQLGTAAGISLGGGTLEIRRDTDFTYAGALNWNANSGTVNINVGEVGTGTTTGVGKTFNFGTLTVTTATGKTLSFGGIGNTGASSSNSVVVNNVTFGAGNLSNTISNNLALPGTLNLGNITGNGTTGTVTLTIGGAGFTMIGDVANGSGGSLTALTYSGAGILQITPTASAATNYTGGLNLTGNGTLRVITNGTAANFGGTTGVITLTGGSGSTGMLDIRTDTGLSVANAIAVVTNSVTINVDAATSGNLSKTVTFDGATTSLTPVAAKTLTLTSGSNYGMTFTNGFSVNFAAYTIANNASGTVNLGALSYTVASGTLILGGSGYTTVGNISGTSGTNLPALTYSGTGFLDLTGNNAASNQVSSVTLSGAGGITRVNSATNLGAANDTVTFSSTTTAATLQVRSDGSGSNGSITFGNAVVFNGAASALGIIDVGNNGGSNTGNTVAFGALTNSGSGNAGTLTINGANGYGVSFTNLVLPSGTANVNTILVANAPVTITGGVTNANTALVNTIADTLILDGVSTGSIAGVIADGTTALTAVTKQGTGTWTFAGANTYTGATTVNNGTLLINGSSVAGSVYTVNGSATQGLQGMLGGSGTIGGAVTLGTNGASAFDLGAVLNAGTVGAAGTLTIGGLLTTNTFSTLSFDLNTASTVGSGVNDLISAALTPVINGNTQIVINTLGMLTVGAYTLINGYSGSIANPGNFTLAAFTGVDTTHGGILINNNGSLQLFVTNATPTNAYWSGAVDGNWNSFDLGTATTNWRTDATSNTDTLALPGSTTNVHFYTTTPAAGNITTTLGSNFAINTLTFDAAATSAVTINGGTLTIDPSSSSTGITLENGAAAATINSAVVMGSAQTWTNNSATSLLTLGGSVSNGGNLLTKAGVGTVTATGVISGGGGLALTAGTFSINQQANTFTGNITVDGASTILSIVGNSAGTYTTSNPLGNAAAGGTNFKSVTLTNGGTFALASQNFNVNVITSTNVGAGMVFNIGTGGGKFDVASGSTFTVDDGTTTGTATTAYQLQGSGGLTKTGNGTLILRQQNAYSGTITVSAGLLQASGTTMATAVAGIIVQSGSALNFAGALVTDTFPVTISGTGLTAAPAGAITNSTGTASYGGAITLAADSAVGGAGTLLTLSGVIDDASGGFGLAKLGTGATTLSSTANTFTGALSINGGTLTLASLANSGSGSNGTGAIVFNNAAVAAILTYTGSGSGSMTGRGISLLGSGGAVTINSNGTGALVFKGSNTNSITGNTTLTLAGTFTGADNAMAGNLTDNAGSVLAITKSGAGTWVLSGTNTYSGVTTVSAGVLQFNGAAALSSATAITLGGGTLSYRDDTAGAIDRTTNALTLTATSTIDVGNNGGTTTGSVVRFGALTQLTAGARTLTFTSANGYSVELASLALSPGTGQTTTLSSTTVNISILGNVTNGMSGFTTAQFDTLALASSTTGNSISGVISDAAGGSFLPLAGGYTKITQSGGGMWRLSGQNTNTGAVAVQNGAIWLAGGDNRLNANGGGVTLGTGTTSGKLIIGGNADGSTTAGSQRSQTLNQINATSILATSGTGTLNSVVGGADGGTSAGMPANNSTLTLNIGAGFTDTYAGLIGWDGTGSVGFQNNINLVKSGAGTLILTGDLTNWTGTMTNAAEGTDLAIDSTRPTITISGGVLRATGVINTVVLQTGGIFDDQTTSHGVNFYLKITGGLVTSNALADNAEDVVETISHGVYAFNFNNAGTTGVSGSDMYIGAVGARVFSGSVLAAGSGNTYRFGGGAPWNAVSTATLGGSGGYLQIATANVVTGANNVIIGDNGSYGSGLGIYGGSSTVEFTAAQNYTGTTTLAGGTLVFTNSNQLGSPATVAGSLILDGGILRYSGALTTDVSNRLTIDSGGTIDTGGNNVTFASALGNSNTGTSDGTSHPTTNSVGGLTKMGAGTLTLTAANTYAGTTTVSGGVLQLNRQTGSLNSASGLTFGGNGTFRLDNTGALGALSQALASLTFSVGDGVILSQRTAAQSTTLTFAALPTRAGGATGNFTVAGSGATTTLNQVVFSTPPTTKQFLNAGLYVSGTNFAAYDVAGYVRALDYTSDTNVAISAGGTTLGAAVTGKDLQFATAAVTAQTTVSINSLKINGAFGITLGSGQTLTIASGGLIKTGTTATITGGTLATSGELVIRQDASTDALTIGSIISAGTGVAGNVALTKSGLGTLTLSTATNVINGEIVINGGVITIDSANRVAGSIGGITVNGGGFTVSSNSTIAKIFTLGLNGGTLTQSNTANDNTFGTAGDVLQFVGLGARTLTLVGGDTRVKTFNFSIGDNGGSTSLMLNGSGDNSVYRLAGANTYTGTTTITRGILRIGALTDLPGGLGGATLSSSNTGGGNLIFAGTGTTRAILEVTSAGGDIYRSVGAGIDQIQWTGNGGFSNQTTNTTRIVNLGGTGATLTWGAGGFVPTGSRLQFSQVGANVAAAGTVDFQNGINFGTAVRTLDVANGSGIVDAILSGNLTFGAGGGFTMTTGLGALSLTGTNNTGSVPVTVTGGTLYFANANAVIGASGTITITYGTSAPAAIGMAGSTNPLLFWNSRLASSSNGAFALDVNSSDALDFSTGNVTNMRLTAFNPGNAAVYYTGTLTPNGTTYRFGGQSPVVGANAPSTTLVLSNKNTLTGARSVDLATGNLTLTASQNYSAGTAINTTQAGANSNVGLGSDAAFGTGTITLGTLANTIAFGAVNGDRVVSNRILDQQPVGNTFVVAADQTSDGIANNTNQGAVTYAGTLDLNARSGTALLHSRTGHAALFLGNITNGTGGLTLNNSTAGLFSFLTGANGGVTKTYSGTTILADNTSLVIDSDGSLGTSGALTIGTSTLILQPGTTGAVVLAGGSTRTLTVTADKSPNFVVGAGGTLAITGAINGGTNTAARTFTKFGAGTLALRGANGTYTGATATFANTMQVYGGKLQLDAVNFSAAADRFIAETTLMPLTFGVASATLGGGGTLEIVHDASKAFALTQGLGNLTINQGSHTIALTNNNVTQALNLNLGSTFTRAALNGGTLNFTSATAGGTNTIGSAIANNAGGIIGGYATFNGLDWAVQSGSSSITALSSGSYTTLVAASNSATGNFILTTGTVALSAASASLNTLKLVGSAGGTNVTLNGTNALTSGGVIFDNTSGSAAISGGQLGATGAEVIIFTGGTGNVSTNKLTLTAIIKGTATVLTKSGSGTLVLAGANTYTGSLIINAGTVEFSNGAASQNLGNPTAGATNIILNGGVLRATATTGLIYGITVNGPAAIDLGSGVTLTQTAQGITGVSSATGLNTGLLQKTGLGTLTLAGTTANSNLSIEIVGGVLNLGKSAIAVGETTNSNGVPYAALIVNNGAVANLTGTGGNQIGDASSVVVKSGGVFDVMGTGATVTTESIDGLAGTGTVRNTVGTLFTLTLGSNNSSNLSPYTLGAAAAGVGSTGLNNFGGVIQGNIALNKIGSGTQILSGNNTYSGSTTINEGTLKLGTTNALPSGAGKGDVTLIGDSTATGVAIGGSATVLAPGTLDLGGYNQAINGLNSTTGGFVTNNPTAGASITNTLTVGSGDANGAFNGVIMDGYSVGADSTTAVPLAYAGTINLSKIGSGTQVLSGANTYTGKTSVTGGVLSISADNNLGAAPGSNVDDHLTLDGGTLQTTATMTITSTRRITIGASGGTFDTAATTTAIINSVILGGGPITKIGAGTLVFTAANTYTGKTSIQEGALSVGSINSVTGGTAGSNFGAPVTVANGTIDMGATTTTGALIYTGTGETTDRVVNLAGTTGGGILDQSGTGVVKFTSNLTATGAGSKVLILQGSTAGTGEISGAIVDNSGTNTTGVTKNGTGTWVLSGTNTYTGATTVNGGTLQVGAGGAGSIGNSAVTVNSTATLSGSGSIAGGTVIGSGGVLAPGDGDPSTSNATLTFSAASASLTVADTGLIQLSLSSADSTDTSFADWFHGNPGGTAADYVTSVGGIANTGSGTSWNDTHSGSHDFISAAGTMVLGSTNTNDKRVVVSLNNLTGVTYGSVFNLMDWSTLGLTHDDSALSAMGAFSVANNLQLQDISSISPGLAWDTSLFDSYGIIVVVPEPGRLLFLMLGLLGLLARRRRRVLA